MNRYNSNKYSKNIIVAGFDNFNQLNENPNNKDKNGDTFIISPPVMKSFDSSLHRSYSIYSWHSVEVTSNGSLFGIGNNEDGSINASFCKTKISQFTEFCVKDNNDHKLFPISAVCYSFGTLYMFTKSNGIGNQLVLCDEDINNREGIFLNIGNLTPVALFGAVFMPLR